MSSNSKHVKTWRKNTKTKIINIFGGGCGICGYNRCNSSLALHHLNPDEKEYGLGQFMAHPRKWEIIKEELKKCILVCHNCHGEIHEGLITIPDNVSRYKECIDITYNKCKSCNSEIDDTLTMCDTCRNTQMHNSLNGRNKLDMVNWDAIDLPNALKSYNMTEISDQFNISPYLIRKKIKLLGLSDIHSIRRNTWKVNWNEVDLIDLSKEHSNSEIARMFNVSETAVRKRKKKLTMSV